MKLSTVNRKSDMRKRLNEIPWKTFQDKAEWQPILRGRYEPDYGIMETSH